MLQYSKNCEPSAQKSSLTVIPGDLLKNGFSQATAILYLVDTEGVPLPDEQVNFSFADQTMEGVAELSSINNNNGTYTATITTKAVNNHFPFIQLTVAINGILLTDIVGIVPFNSELMVNV